MNKTTIEWVRNPDGSQGYTLNPLVGCSGEGCAVKKVCFARKISRRQAKRCYRCAAFTPHEHFIRFRQVTSGRRKGIFLCDMADWMDRAFPNSYIRSILSFIRRSGHRYYTLTKQADRLRDFHYYPPNLWLGVTVNTLQDLWRVECLEKTDAKVKFVSLEPLYSHIPYLFRYKVDWIIVGAQTRPNLQPQLEWVEDLVDQARKMEVPIFLKNNIQWPLTDRPQEFPKA